MVLLVVVIIGVLCGVGMLIVLWWCFLVWVWLKVFESVWWVMFFIGIMSWVKVGVIVLLCGGGVFGVNWVVSVIVLVSVSVMLIVLFLISLVRLVVMLCFEYYGDVWFYYLCQLCDVLVGQLDVVVVFGVVDGLWFGCVVDVVVWFVEVDLCDVDWFVWIWWQQFFVFVVGYVLE